MPLVRKKLAPWRWRRGSRSAPGARRAGFRGTAGAWATASLRAPNQVFPRNRSPERGNVSSARSETRIAFETRTCPSRPSRQIRYTVARQTPSRRATSATVRSDRTESRAPPAHRNPCHGVRPVPRRGIQPRRGRPRNREVARRCHTVPRWRLPPRSLGVQVVAGQIQSPRPPSKPPEPARDSRWFGAYFFGPQRAESCRAISAFAEPRRLAVPAKRDAPPPRSTPG